MAANKVLAGDYENLVVGVAGGKPYLILKAFKTMNLDKTNVESYELITNETTKSAASGVVRGAVGSVLLGPVGLLAGGLSAKNKGSYTVAIKFKDGKNSLLEVDEKIYKGLMQVMF